jgi:hypothetical protein
VTRPLAKTGGGFQKKMLKVFSLNLLEREAPEERDRDRENSYNCYLKKKTVSPSDLYPSLPLDAAHREYMHV